MKKKFVNITPVELQAKGVVALADRPNVASNYGVGGLSPANLKLWFDKLARFLADKINLIQDGLSKYGQDYIGINNLGEDIQSLADLTASFLNGSFATILLAYQSAADVGDEKKLVSLQQIINEKARLIATLDEKLTNYIELIKSNKGAEEVGISDSYNGENKKLSDVIADIANGVLATKITFSCYGFASNNKNTPTSTALKTFVDNVTDALQGELNSGLLEMINNRYTKTQIDALLDEKVDKSTYTKEQNIQDGRLDSLEERTDTIEENIGDVSDFAHIAPDIAMALKSLNEDIDSLQLGVVPRKIRGVIYNSSPDVLNEELKAKLTQQVLSATGRNIPDNTDAVNVIDNAMPDAGRVFTYYYWASPQSSEADGWYLAAIYTAPTITEIPSYVFNILNSSWSVTPDENGLYYITINAATHGMGTDNSLCVELRKFLNDKYESINLFYVTTTGDIIIYTDEKFTGKLIVRVGKAYYTADTTHIEKIDMDKVTGLNEALNEKLAKDGDGSLVTSAVDTAQTSTATLETTPNIQSEVDRVLASGLNSKTRIGRLSAFLKRLKKIAFKDKITDSEIDDNTISQSKISGLSNSLGTKLAHTGGDSKACVATFEDYSAETRANISTGETHSTIFSKIKRYFSDLGSLAFKSKIGTEDFDEDASITNATNAINNADGTFNAFTNIYDDLSKNKVLTTNNKDSKILIVEQKELLYSNPYPYSYVNGSTEVVIEDNFSQYDIIEVVYWLPKNQDTYYGEYGSYRFKIGSIRSGSYQHIGTVHCGANTYEGKIIASFIEFEEKGVLHQLSGDSKTLTLTSYTSQMGARITFNGEENTNSGYVTQVTSTTYSLNRNQYTPKIIKVYRIIDGVKQDLYL